MIKDNIIKHSLTALFLFFGVRQYLVFSDIYNSLFMLIIFISLIKAESKY